MQAKGTNAPCRPEFEGQLVRYRSPHARGVWLVDEARRNKKHGYLEWWAVIPGVDPEYQAKLDQAMVAE